MDAAIPMLTSLQKVKPEPDPFDLLHLELPVGIPGVSLMAMAFVQPIISVTSTLHSKQTAMYADSCHRIPRKSSELTAMSPWVPPVVVSFFANIRPLLPPLLRAVGFSHVWNGL